MLKQLNKYSQVHQYVYTTKSQRYVHRPYFCNNKVIHIYETLSEYILVLLTVHMYIQDIEIKMDHTY